MRTTSEPGPGPKPSSPVREPGSTQGEGGIVQRFAQQALGEREQGLAGLGQDKRLGSLRPLQFEAGSLRGNPYLADGRVWRNHELAGAVLKDDVHDAVVVFELEAARPVFGGDDGLLQGFEGVVGFAAEAGFVKHGSSVVADAARRVDGTPAARTGCRRR